MRVWASAPDSVDTAAFVDALSPHALALEGVKHAADARIWIVDGAAPTTLARVQYLAVQPVPAVAYLGERMDALPHPGWALFKTPVKPLLVAHWLLLHGLVNRAPASPAPTVPAPARAPRGRELWRLSPVQLSRWPQLGRYGHDLYLIAACAQLLKAPTPYAELLAGGAAPARLDALLAEAWADGILRVVSVSAVRPPSAAPTGPAPRAAAAPSRPAELTASAPRDAEHGGLVKGLLSWLTQR